jgi:hypothetical protein
MNTDSFHSSTPTYINGTGYLLTAAAIKRIKSAARIASPSGAISWQSIAARPATALEFCRSVESTVLRDRK